MSLSQIESQILDISTRFKRLIYDLGSNNSSGYVVVNNTVTRLTDNDGNVIGPSDRYNFEVDFAYILLNIQRSPSSSISQKYIDKAYNLIGQLNKAILNKRSTTNV